MVLSQVSYLPEFCHANDFRVASVRRNQFLTVYDQYNGC